MEENYSILFVDDEINVLNSLERGLIDTDYKCFFVTNGPEALGIMEKENICVIVSDMRMPGMDGLTLLRIVKEKYPKTVRIVLSGYAQLQQILLTINKAEVFRFITKPWKLEEEFINVIESAIEYYKILHENEIMKQKLESQTNVYKNAIDKIDDKILAERKKTDIIGSLGKFIMDFNKAIIQSQIMTGMSYYKIFEAIESFYDNTIEAAYTNEVELNEEEIVDELVRIIKGYVQLKSIDNKINHDKRINVNLKIVEASIKLFYAMLREEIVMNSSYVVAGVNTNNELVFSIVSQERVNERHLTLETKLMFLRDLFINVKKYFNVSMSVSYSSGNIIFVVIFD